MTLQNPCKTEFQGWNSGSHLTASANPGFLLSHHPTSQEAGRGKQQCYVQSIKDWLLGWEWGRWEPRWAVPCPVRETDTQEQSKHSLWQPSYMSHGSVIVSCKHSHATPLAYKIFTRLIQELFQTGSDSSSLRTTLNSILIGYASERRGLRPAVAYTSHTSQWNLLCANKHTYKTLGDRQTPW